MVKPRTSGWQKKYVKLVRQHYKDQQRIRRLNNQMHHLMVKHTNMKFNIAQEGQKYIERIQMIEDLHRELSQILHSKQVILDPKRREKLRKIQQRLPTNTLSDRIQLMELLVLHDRCRPFENANWLQFWHGRDIQRQVAIEKSIDRISKKTLKVISDIHDLQSMNNYVKNTRATRFQIEPSMPKGFRPPTAKQADMATITMSSTHQSHRKQLAVRPKYILKNVPELMPDMFYYLKV